MSGQGGHGGGWSPFRPSSPYGPSPPPRLGGPEMNTYSPRPPFMSCPRPRWPSPRPAGPPSPIPQSHKPFRLPMHPPSPAPMRCSSPADYYRGVSPYTMEFGTVYRASPYAQEVGSPIRDYEYVGVALEPPPLPQNYEPEDDTESGPSTAEIIANQSQDYVDEKLAEYQATIYQLQGKKRKFILKYN